MKKLVLSSVVAVALMGSSANAGFFDSLIKKVVIKIFKASGAKASTGKAISSLRGVAAENATLRKMGEPVSGVAKRFGKDISPKKVGAVLVGAGALEAEAKAGDIASKAIFSDKE